MGNISNIDKVDAVFVRFINFNDLILAKKLLQGQRILITLKTLKK